MGKILYPVGTIVLVRRDKTQTPYEVLEYKKGEKYPYRLKACTDPFDEQVSVDGKTKFSVKGLKNFNNTATKKQTAKKTSCGECEKVAEVARVGFQEAMSRLEEVRDIAVQAYEDAEENRKAVMQMASLVDRNFMTVSKQFKSLSHDDD